MDKSVHLLARHYMTIWILVVCSCYHERQLLKCIKIMVSLLYRMLEIVNTKEALVDVIKVVQNLNCRPLKEMYFQVVVLQLRSMVLETAYRICSCKLDSNMDIQPEHNVLHFLKKKRSFE